MFLREAGIGRLMVDIRVMAVTPHTQRACRRAQVTRTESLFADLLDMEYPRTHKKLSVPLYFLFFSPCVEAGGGKGTYKSVFHTECHSTSINVHVLSVSAASLPPHVRSSEALLRRTV